MMMEPVAMGPSFSRVVHHAGLVGVVNHALQCSSWLAGIICMRERLATRTAVGR